VKRFLATFSVLLAVALASTGCNISSSSSVAARVNSSVITTAKLDALMAELKGDSALLCLGGGVSHTTGNGTGTWSEAYAGYVLAQLIKFEVLRNVVVAHHLSEPASDMSAAKAQVEADLAQATRSGCTGTGSQAIADAGATFRSDLVANQLDDDAYSAYLAGTSLQSATLASWEQAHRAALAESCTSVIQVSTEALARKLAAAIRGGASFAAEATSHSQSSGTGAGGALGCILESQWAAGLGPKVAALSVGAVSAPVSYESGWLLFLVTRRVTEPLPGVLNLLTTSELNAFDQHYAGALGAAHVTVSPLYGTWHLVVSKAGVDVSIVPPSHRACTYAPQAADAGCPTTSPASTSGSAGAG
jgi:hypothetical protein